MVSEKSLKNLEANKGKGRPKGVPNKCTAAKDAYFRAFFQLGGIKRLKKVLNGSDKDMAKILLDTLPSLMPKKTEIKGERGRVIIMEVPIIDRPKNSGLSEE